MSPGLTVSVTGACGFLGQHIVRLLQEDQWCIDNISEIRALDLKIYSNNLGYTEVIPVTTHTGDIRNIDDITRVLRGTDAVIHTASLIDVSMFPNEQLLKEVNVTGTSNIVSACISEGVNCLVYTSTQDVIMGNESVHNGDESIPEPKDYMFRGYGRTKMEAEKIVLNANGKLLKGDSNGTLLTLSLRPTTLYGEGDPILVPEVMKMAKQNCGTLVRIGNGLFQTTYIGNIAWAHVHAMKRLLNKDASVSGEVYFITDDTPVTDLFDFAKPYLAARGFSVSKFRIPFFVVYYGFLLFQTLIWLIHPICKVNPKSVSRSSILSLNKSVCFSGQKGRSVLGYTPKYSHEESFKRSLSFYLTVDIS